jgi:hypothetical protein
MLRHAIALGIASATLIAACSGATASKAPSSAPATAPPASAAAMQVMGKGDLKPIDGTATGVAELVALPGGAYAVILDQFSAGSTAHTNVILVSNASVTKTADVDKTKILDLGPLKGTSGMQTYAIPASMAATVMDGYHSVVIWDTEMAHAIAAAALK